MDNSFIIDNLLQQNESVRLEYKATVNLGAIARAITAFINTRGGDLIVGVDDEKNIVGVPNVDTAVHNIQKYLVKHIKPIAPIAVQAIPYKGSDVILISVWEGAKKPYQYNNEIFNRRGQHTNSMQAAKLPDLIRQRKKADFHWERMPVLGAEIKDDLDITEIKKTIRLYKEFSKEEIADTEDFLMRTGLMQNGNITNACIVLFGKTPIRFIPQSRIRVTLYPGKASGNQFLDDRIFEGNIFKNITAIFEFLETVFGKTLTVKGLVRTDKHNYPVVAMREGILNAIVHRDYNSVNGFLQVSVFSDRTEIANYGALPKGISIADLKTEHNSILRNPDIAQMCFYRKYIEMLGSGTLRMIKDCKENKFREPVWKVQQKITTVVFVGVSHHRMIEGISKGVTGGISKTTLKKIEGITEGITEGIKDKMKQMLVLLYNNEGSRTVDMEEQLEIPAKSLERYIKILRDAGLIEYKGAKRSGGYYLTKKSRTQLK
ncbi:MAG TPA: putative DNA binding domain-containing protein [Agriterribacter sp.]|nr:putative DNA binding domain-containing protein [Agriterribacter sp.]